MKNQRSIDSNFFIRGLFLHCFIHIYRIFTAVDPRQFFQQPRYELFKKINKKFQKGENALFRNILINFKWRIAQAGIMTIIFVFFNLLVPQLIKMFMHFLHGHTEQKNQVRQAQVFIRNLVGVQLLRIIFGQHSRRLFFELAIKVQSTLSKMLIQKSLNLAKKARKDIPQSQILQLQNVDLKLVFTMLNNMMFIFQAPLTIIVALIMLFVQSKTYGLVGAYWFLIAFLLHRQLDEKMTHCNATKLGLIQKRSKANYEMLFGIKQARMIGWQDVMIQKNNDLFEEQNHDHALFYFYNSLYDIILLMLPVLVVVTICVVDANELKPITVQQVYLMLSLLGICYEPMKNIRTISISFHDGLHSLNRIQQFFDMPEQKVDKDFISSKIQQGHLAIQKQTVATFPGTVYDFVVRTKFQIEAGPGDRLVIIGRKGQGRSAFLNMINGFMQKIQGSIRINGTKACFTETFFFSKTTVKDNIIFYNENFSQQQVQKISYELGITQQLKNIGGLSASMADISIFSKSLLQRISIARVLCSGANIYTLDRPIEGLEHKYEIIVQKLLRKKQQEKVLIIMTIGQIAVVQPQDKIAIISNGIIQEYGKYSQIVQNKQSTIFNFYRSKQQKQYLLSPMRSPSLTSPLKNKFKDAVRKVTAFNNTAKTLNAFKSLKAQQNTQGQQVRAIDELMKTISTKKQFMLKQQREREKQKQKGKHKTNIITCLKSFIAAAPIIEIFFIMIIIACAQLLHVFIHFFIGHLEEEHGHSSYLNFRSMLVIQVLLTLGLAGVLYYEGEVSTMIAIIQGNEMYKNSLFSLIRKKISYFATQYPVRIADKFNHDYQQVFIACHGVLTIYKNIIILIVTVIFISNDGYTVLIFFTVIISLYTAIYLILRKVQNSVIEHYYNYKYGFVKSFEQSLQGAQYFAIYGSKHSLIKRAEGKYRSLAAYKQAERFTNHGLSIACDIMGNILLASIVYYGLQMKLHNTKANIAMIATSIHLLMNGSQVLKTILKETINFQTFFSINILPFISINDYQKSAEHRNSKTYQRPDGYEILFENLILAESDDPGQSSYHDQSHKLNIKIKEGEHIFIYNSTEYERNLLLYALTNNLDLVSVPKNRWKNGGLYLGYAKISQIDPEQLFMVVGVIMNKNFYFTGTLRDNLVRKIIIDQQEVDQYIKLLKLDEDIDDYDIKGLDSKIYFDNTNTNFELTKKFALLRILLYKSKVIIIKDTTNFIGSINIIEILEKYLPKSTIININDKVQSAFGASKILHVQNSMLIQEGTPQQLMNKTTSPLGSKLKNLNMDDYIFKQQVSRAKIPLRLRKKKN